MGKIRSLVIPDTEIHGAGAVTFWRLSGEVDIVRLTSAWLNAGLDEDLLPKRTSQATALNRAVTALREKHRLVRKLKTVWVVVDEHVSEDEDPDYNPQCKVGFDEDGNLKIDPEGHPLEQEIRLAYDHALEKTWDSEQISEWLTGLVNTMKAIALRDKGGVYYIPPQFAEQFEKMTTVIEANTAHSVSYMPAMESRYTVKTVLSSVIREAETEAQKILKSLTEEDLGANALATKMGECEMVAQKVSYYEELLGTSLTGLKEKLDDLNAHLAAAAFRAASEE